MHRLRVATWNIHKGIGTDRRYEIERTLDVLASMDADVLCLQEVDERVPRSSLHPQARVMARELGYDHVALGLNVAVRGGHYGNCTLSRWPFHHVRNLDLTIPPKKRRSSLVTRIHGPGGRDWTVANVHLGLLHMERRVQLTRLFEELRRHAPDGVGLVVAGDLNDWGFRLATTIQRLDGLRVARSDVGPRAGPRTFPSRHPVAALDKILVRTPVEVSHVGVARDPRTWRASDHLPLWADLRLPS
jgi:endonuclease/exonuclease/phosphatase family metal-dependent hydrolase